MLFDEVMKVKVGKLVSNDRHKIPSVLGLIFLICNLRSFLRFKKRRLTRTDSDTPQIIKKHVFGPLGHLRDLSPAYGTINIHTESINRLI